MMQRERSLPRRRTRQRTEPGHTPSLGVGRTKPERCIPQTAPTKLPKPSSVSRVAECCILQTCFHSPLLRFLLAFTRYMDYTHTMPTSHFYYVYILWDASTHTHFYVGHTSDLAARLKTHNAGHVPHTSKYAPWEIHSAIAVQTEEQASELEKYFKSHSGREWVIKHLGLPMGMTSHS